MPPKRVQLTREQKDAKNAKRRQERQLARDAVDEDDNDREADVVLENRQRRNTANRATLAEGETPEDPVSATTATATNTGATTSTLVPPMGSLPPNMIDSMKMFFEFQQFIAAQQNSLKPATSSNNTNELAQKAMKKTDAKKRSREKAIVISSSESDDDDDDDDDDDTDDDDDAEADGKVDDTLSSKVTKLLKDPTLALDNQKFFLDADLYHTLKTREERTRCMDALSNFVDQKRKFSPSPRTQDTIQTIVFSVRTLFYSQSTDSLKDKLVRLSIQNLLDCIVKEMMLLDGSHPQMVGTLSQLLKSDSLPSRYTSKSKQVISLVRNTQLFRSDDQSFRHSNAHRRGARKAPRQHSKRGQGNGRQKQKPVTE